MLQVSVVDFVASRPILLGGVFTCSERQIFQANVFELCDKGFRGVETARDEM